MSRTDKSIITGLAVCCVLFTAPACTSSQSGGESSPGQSLDRSVVQVEGQVSSRGNAPFEALVLETSDRNMYVLVFDGDAPNFEYGALYSVSGLLHSAEWNGAKYAHINVASHQKLAME